MMKLKYHRKETLRIVSKINPGEIPQLDEPIKNKEWGKRKMRGTAKVGRFGIIMFENWTFEEWNIELVKKYQNLYKTVNELIPELWNPLEFALSIKTILNIKNCTLPFAGILLGPPSSLKSQVVELFRKWKNSYYTDNFTARTFVSHYAGIRKNNLKK